MAEDWRTRPLGSFPPIYAWKPPIANIPLAQLLSLSLDECAHTYQLTQDERFCLDIVFNVYKGYSFWHLTETTRFFDFNRSHFIVIPPTPEELDQLQKEVMEEDHEGEEEDDDEEGEEETEDEDEEEEQSVEEEVEDEKVSYPQAYRAMFAKLAKTKGRFALPCIFVDHLEELLGDLAKIAGRLNDNQNQGNGGVARVVLGANGIGKSAFTQSFAIATSLVCPDVVTIYVNYAREPPSEATLPSQMLYYAIKTLLNEQGDFKDATQLNSLQEVVGKINHKICKRFIIIADDFEHVYACGTDIGRKIAIQFRTLGATTTGQFSTIITGHTSLYNVLFASNFHLHLIPTIQYPIISLGNTQYFLRCFYPVPEILFRKFLYHIVHARAANSQLNLNFETVEFLRTVLKKEDPEEMERLYKFSGGKIGTLLNICKNELV